MKVKRGPSKDLGDRLRATMEARNVKPAELAALCGVRAPSVYDWMNHGRIAKRHIPRIAERLGTSLGYWLGAEEGDDDLCPKERMLLTMYRAMSPTHRDRLLKDAQVLLSLQQEPGNIRPRTRLKAKANRPSVGSRSIRA